MVWVGYFVGVLGAIVPCGCWVLLLRCGGLLGCLMMFVLWTLGFGFDFWAVCWCLGVVLGVT